MKHFLMTCALAGAMAPAAFAEDTVSWWYESATPEQQGFLQDLLVAPFEAAHPDIKIRIDYRGSELDKQLRVAMLSGTGPDLVFTPGPSYVAPMAQAGQLLALDDYAASMGWNDRILPVFLEMGRYDGKLYALPKTYETLGLFYNKTLFDEHGWTPPTNIDELEALCDEMIAAGITPFAAGNANWRGANEWFVSIALNSIAGPDNVYKALTGEIPWTAPPFVEAINKLDEWWAKGYFSKDYFSLNNNEQTADLVASGKAGMMPSGTWSFANVSIYFPENGTEAGFVGFPSKEGDPVFALGVGSTLSVNAKSQVADQTAEVLNYIFTPEFYGTMGSAWQGEWNMPLTDLSGVTMADNVMPLYTQVMADLANSVAKGSYGYTTWTFLPPATDSYLINGMEEVWLDRITTEDYLAQLDETFQQEKAEGKVPAIPAR